MCFGQELSPGHVGTSGDVEGSCLFSSCRYKSHRQDLLRQPWTGGRGAREPLESWPPPSPSGTIVLDCKCSPPPARSRRLPCRSQRQRRGQEAPSLGKESASFAMTLRTERNEAKLHSLGQRRGTTPALPGREGPPPAPPPDTPISHCIRPCIHGRGRGRGLQGSKHHQANGM